MTRQNAETKTVNLALQGGGAHGALAWGMLDALLDDGRIKVEGITACSAGTMNALAFAQGMMENGADGARKKLEEFWWEISKSSFFLPTRGNPFERAMGLGEGENPFGLFFLDTVTKVFSPYQLNPLDINPLREATDKVIDFDKIAACDCLKLFISATNVRTGKGKIFKTPEISLDVAMASACLPHIFKAVEIEGEYYWDGGFSGNPPLYPLFYETESRDIVLIHINPMFREEIPTTGPAIMSRLNEVTFNAALLKDLRAVSFVKKLIEQDMLKDEYKHLYKDLLIHSIRADDTMKDYSMTSKYDTSWDFLTELRDMGHKGMKKWLKENFENLGERSSIDLYTEFLDGDTQATAAANPVPKKISTAR
jgi:NTE family protein